MSVGIDRDPAVAVDQPGLARDQQVQGQPAAGRICPLPALGTETNNGTVCIDVTTGNGLATVMLVDVGLRPRASKGAT